MCTPALSVCLSCFLMSMFNFFIYHSSGLKRFFFFLVCIFVFGPHPKCWEAAPGSVFGDSFQQCLGDVWYWGSNPFSKCKAYAQSQATIKSSLKRNLIVPHTSFKMRYYSVLFWSFVRRVSCCTYNPLLFDFCSIFVSKIDPWFLMQLYFNYFHNCEIIRYRM